MSEHTQTFSLLGKEIKLSTGKLATLAQGSVLLQMGGTSVLATASIDSKDSEQDFFPLSVEYIERMYARGAISGSRFAKREGYPADEAIIKARQVDHSIRSLFPKSFRKPTGVILTVMSYDRVNDPELLAVFGASVALMLSGVPYYGPSSSVVACVDENNNIVINPEVDGREGYLAEFLISGVDDKLLNIEGWGKEVSEEVMDQLLDQSMVVIKQLNQFQRDFAKAVLGKEVSVSAEEFSDLPAPEALIEEIKKSKHEEIEKALFIEKDSDTNRSENLRVIKDQLVEEYSKSDDQKYSAFEIDLAVEYVAKKTLRHAAFSDGKRVTSRKLDEIRPLYAEVDLLPTVHGSALFGRGLTQSLSIVTLGSQKLEQILDEMEGETTKSFMHHYNMPPFSTGEAGRYSYKPGRREVGHGAIGENALKNMIPSEEDFPYTIRVVSEILTSNGSTSMAATCASSMALMAAGVPLKEAVAGIGVGLITSEESEDNYVLLLDIEGIEDFYGDMDFKVTGTKNGITAIQYENKLRGVKIPVLKEAFRLAKRGRGEVLDVMNKAISTPRTELAPTAPVVESMMIKTDKIGELIGPGGKNIKELVQKSEQYGKEPADVNIDDSGKVSITAANRQQLDYVKKLIEESVGEAELNKEYIGVVDKIMPYGVFVDVSSSISGLLHVSEIFDKHGNFDLSKTFREGDELRVRVIRMEDGRVNFTVKGIQQSEEMNQKLANPVEGIMPQEPRRDNRRFDNRRRN
jgi:polyribonucleotide nucleotidyltransferase